MSAAKTALADASLDAIAQMKRLIRFDLDGAHITGKGLGRLAALEKLGDLSRADTPLTGTGLAQLAALKGLRSLDIRKTPVSPGAVARLRRALPKCEINRDEVRSPAGCPLTWRAGCRADGAGTRAPRACATARPAGILAVDGTLRRFTCAPILRPQETAAP